MLPIPSIMSTNKMVIVIKDISTKSIHINSIIFTISIKSRTNVHKINIKNKIRTTEVPYLGENIWSFFVSDEIHKTDE